MASLIEIESEKTFETTVKSSPSTLHVLYFHTPWAAPCAQMHTILTTLASTYPKDKSISFLSINAEDLPDVSESYDVTAVPFIVLERDGKELETVSGSDATKVRVAVERHAGSTSKSSIPPMLEATPRTNGTKEQDATAHAGSAPSTAAADSKDELWQRLDSLVKAAPVMLFMKGTPAAPQCGFSRQLVSMLRENGVKYGFFNILADDDVRQGLKEYADWPTFPQLWTSGELVGGLDIVKEELEADPDFLKAFAAPKTNTDTSAPQIQSQLATATV